jgi:hypothetical protein
MEVESIVLPHVSWKNDCIDEPPIVLRDLCEKPKCDEFDKLLVGEKKDLWMSVRKILEVLWESQR